MSVSTPRPSGRTGAVPILIGALRVAVGLFFILPGIMKFTIHAEEVELFERWGVPAPELAVTATGIIEIAAGVALAAGVAMPVPAILLAATMIGALLTAGRVDGGQHLILPTVLLALLAVIVAGRGGRWQLGGRLLPGSGQESTPTPGH
ncbi:MAG: DoxX family protein [Dermatophilaceae bacterium]